jgi:hypothetical protein
MPLKFSLKALWPSKSTPAESASSEHASSLSPEDCFRIALLLRRLPLPPDVIPSILDYARAVAEVVGTETERPAMISQRNSGIVHSATAIPTHIHRPSVRSVVFTTISHDQGWSWDTNNQGTYNGSCTWFEAGTLMKTSEPGLENCKRIVTNIHASKEFKKHRVEWFVDDPEHRLIFKKLLEGEFIGLNVCACYPGWQNMVKFSSISFRYQPVRKVP